MISKNDLKLIEAVVAKDSQKAELNFARFDFRRGIVFASDSKRALKFYNNFGDKNHGVRLAHKQTIKSIIAIASKKQPFTFLHESAVFQKITIPLNNSTKEGVIDFDAIGLGMKEVMPVEVEATKIAFEIYKKGIFFFDAFLNPLIAHSKDADLKYLLYTNGKEKPIVISGVDADGETVFDYIINPIY